MNKEAFQQMKKWIILLMAFAIALAPIGFGADVVEAKKFGGYKSGKKTFNNNVTPNKSDSNLNSTKTPGATSKNTATGTGARGGGFMSGLMFGGLAGLLFGSMFDGLGAFGAILGFMVNMLAIVALIGIVFAAFTYIKNSRRHQDSNQWKRS